MQCSNVSGIVGRGKTLFFPPSELGNELKINTKIPLVFGKCCFCPKLSIVVREWMSNDKEPGFLSQLYV